MRRADPSRAEPSFCNCPFLAFPQVLMSNSMLRRLPTKIELKLDDIDDMCQVLERMVDKGNMEPAEPQQTAQSTPLSQVRWRIGAAPARVGMEQASDMQAYETPESAPSNT
ncbi:unnamed protein product [Gongylonema pulchrum]|uniref:RNA polymerase II transcription factor B subunit 5 n=1 Tax=Gongylonema pulchrum TaxID=637853 RepID=A0A183E471_9BILA|nr:unnamed protein product [Gongylonema pulchrum]